MKAFITSVLTLVLLAGILLPALHAFVHNEHSESDFLLEQQVSDAAVDCELCDFHFATSDVPPVYAYEVHSPQKETVYSLSLAETVNLFPSPLFSLRAPPAVIS